MTRHADIGIIGASAAGLSAAYFAARAPNRPSVIVLDGAKRLGAKILVSGGGRCNVTHKEVVPDDFNPNPSFVRPSLRAFSVKDTQSWFDSLGVSMKVEDTGKLFPISDSAKTVVTALTQGVRDVGAVVVFPARAQSVAYDGDRFVVETSQGPFSFRHLILCTGGRALPKSGSDGWGYDVVQEFGHTITRTFPALVPLEIAKPKTTPLAGLSLNAHLKVAKAEHRGSLLFTHKGISGPVVLDISRHFLERHVDGVGTVWADWLDASFPEDANRTWEQRFPRRNTEAILTDLVPSKLAEVLPRWMGVPSDRRWASLSGRDRKAVWQGLTALPFEVTGHTGWNKAEATSGGIAVDEVDRKTMQSKKRPGLYFAGEILDVDGRLGGFNFQWAWSSGFVAGRAAAKSLVL